MTELRRDVLSDIDLSLTLDYEKDDDVEKYLLAACGMLPVEGREQVLPSIPLIHTEHVPLALLVSHTLSGQCARTQQIASISPSNWVLDVSAIKRIRLQCSHMEGVFKHKIQYDESQYFLFPIQRTQTFRLLFVTVVRLKALLELCVIVYKTGQGGGSHSPTVATSQSGWMETKKQS